MYGTPYGVSLGCFPLAFSQVDIQQPCHWDILISKPDMSSPVPLPATGLLVPAFSASLTMEDAR
ncbi:hypothetical protein ColTof3_11266 [Colletotrichum tofieldiae]|nr:hypothetical protein ColTof3_11266 [Colletotrichum tofieldiae]